VVIIKQNLNLFGGVVAIMKSLRPDLSPTECQKILRETSHPLNYHGVKALRVLDALAAVKCVKGKQ